MNTPLPAEPRSEPLLWLQLLGLAALPLEALLLLLLLAGSDPGPWPWLERVLAWSLGVLAPALLLWRRPADAFSLLVISTPLRGRRELQRRLSAQQQALGLRLAMALGAAALLPLLAWLDRWSVLARELAPLPEAPRLVALLLSAAMLALMLWQWQQLLQAAWLLLRPAAALAVAPALSSEQIAASRLCLGLPLLLPDPLRFDARPGRDEPKRTASSQRRPVRPETGAASEAPSIEPHAAARVIPAEQTVGGSTEHSPEVSLPPQDVPMAAETHDSQDRLNPQDNHGPEDGLDPPTSPPQDDGLKQVPESEIESDAVEPSAPDPEADPVQSIAALASEAAPADSVASMAHPAVPAVAAPAAPDTAAPDTAAPEAAAPEAEFHAPEARG
ncbi:MAG: low-complexity tail membrane protein [Synechococcaceae cyanobacterium]